METVPCNICGSSSQQVLYRVSDWLLERPEVQSTLVRCRDCGLIYQNPRPTAVEMGQHYPSDYEPFHSYESKKPSWLLRKAIEYGMDNRAKLVTSAVYSGKLLDVGCAAGDFLDHVRQKGGWEVQGVEISPFAADLARRKYHLDVFTGTLEEACFADETFDAVTMWDVLEHLHDPADSLKEVHRILKPGGVLAFRVPNGDSFDAKLFGPYWSGLDAPRHLYVFQKRTLQTLLNKSGFRMARATSRNGSYLSFVLSLRLWMVAKGVRQGLRDNLMRVLYHPVGRILSAPLFYLYSLPQRTSQLMVTAVKDAAENRS